MGSQERRRTVMDTQQDSVQQGTHLIDELDQLVEEDDYAVEAPVDRNSSSVLKRIRDYSDNAREARAKMQLVLENERHYAGSRLVPTDDVMMRKLMEYGSSGMGSIKDVRSPVAKHAPREAEGTRSKSRGASTEQVSTRKLMYRTVNDLRGVSARRRDYENTEPTLA